jgi:hypothetical protein
MTLRSTLLLGPLLLLATACGSGPSGSGFLGGPEVYEALEPSPNFGRDVMVWTAEDLDLKRYTRIRIRRVKVMLNEEGQERGVDPGQAEQLATFFRKQLEEVFALGHPVVDFSDESTLEIRTALTDVRPSRPKAGMPLPTTVLFGLGVGGATLEAEFLDGGTGKRLAAALVNAEGKSYKIAKGWTTWGHAQDVLRYWAETIRARVDALQGKKRRW